MKKIISIGFVLFCVIAAIAYSSGGSEGTAKAVTISIWMGTDTQATTNVFKQYTAATGNKFDFYMPGPNGPSETDIIPKWAAGERPDLLCFHVMATLFSQLRPEETLQEISNDPILLPVLQKEPESARKLLSYNGKEYSVAFRNFPIFGIFYNKQIKDKVGYDFPKSHKDFMAVCKKVKDAGYIPVYMGGADKWPLQLYSMVMTGECLNNGLGADVNSGKKKLTDPAFVSTIQDTLDLWQAGYINDDTLGETYNKSLDAIMTDKAAFVAMHDYFLRGLVETYGLDAVDKKIGFFPLSENGTIVTIENVTGALPFQFPKNADKAKSDAAKKFAAFFASQPIYQQWVNDDHGIPLLKGFKPAEKIPLAYLTQVDAYNKNIVVGDYKVYLKANAGPFETYLQEMIAGKKTALDVAQAMQDQFDLNVKAMQH